MSTMSFHCPLLNHLLKWQKLYFGIQYHFPGMDNDLLNTMTVRPWIGGTSF